MRGLQWKTVLIYLDYVIVVSATYQEHISRLREVLMRFREHGLKLKPRKCHLFQRQVEFLGHTVNREGVHTNPKNSQASPLLPHYEAFGDKNR